MIYKALRQHDTSLNRDFTQVSHGLQVVREKENFRIVDRKGQQLLNFHGLADTGVTCTPDTLIREVRAYNAQQDSSEHFVRLNGDVDFAFMSTLTEADGLYYLFSHCERCGQYLNSIFVESRLGGLCRECDETLERRLEPKLTFSAQDNKAETLNFQVSQYDAERYYAGNAWFE